MNEPVMCANCGATFPYQKLKIYKNVLKKRYTKKLQEQQPIDIIDNAPHMGDVLDKLGYKNLCCRKTIICYRTLNDVIAERLGENIFTK